jgi:hypothetical protein
MTWIPIAGTPALPYPETYTVPSIGIDAAGYLYVGTADQGVLRSRLPVGVSATDVGDVTVIAWLPGPNPFRDVATFGLELGHREHVSLCVYDVGGRVVSRLWEGADLPAGRHVARWTADHRVASGTYFYRLSVGAGVRSGRLTRMR